MNQIVRKKPSNQIVGRRALRPVFGGLASYLPYKSNAPGIDPRVLKGMDLVYAASGRGACHLRATFYKSELTGMIPPDQIEGKAELFVEKTGHIIKVKDLEDTRADYYRLRGRNELGVPE